MKVTLLVLLFITVGWATDWSTSVQDSLFPLDQYKYENVEFEKIFEQQDQVTKLLSTDTLAFEVEELRYDADKECYVFLSSPIVLVLLKLYRSHS